MALTLPRKLASFLGYEVVKTKREATLRSCLTRLFDQLEIDTILDIGANNGQYGTKLREMGFTGDILSFEPITPAFERLTEAAKGDRRWRLFNFALGKQSCSKSINISHSTDFTSFLDANEYGLEKFGKMEVKAQQEVQIRTLDEVLYEVLPDVDNRRLFMKMDTQGYDLQVFEGSQHTLKYILGMQSEVAVLKIYAEMPDYLEAIARYREGGFEPVGLFPVNKDPSGVVIEFDIVMRNMCSVAKSSG